MNAPTMPAARSPRGAGAGTALRWGTVFAVAFLARMLLPCLPADTARVHLALAHALAAGQSWGRQGFVGSLEFPPLPTLALLAARVLLHTPPALTLKLATAGAQAWVLCCFLRHWSTPRNRILALGAVAAAVALIPNVRSLFLAGDPGWIAAVPLSIALLHGNRWFQQRRLREWIVVALACGALGFAGPAGMAAALLIGIAMIRAAAAAARPGLGKSRKSPPGYALLMETPFIYAVAVLVLVNWLILGAPFVFARRLVALATAAPHPGTYAPGLAAVPFFLYGVLALWAWFLHRPDRAHCLRLCGLAGLGIAVTLAAGRFIGFFISGAEVLLIVALFPALFRSLITPGARRPALRLAESCFAAAILAGETFRPAPPQTGARFLNTAPPREEVLACIDREWPRARVLVYGMRVPACFPDPTSRRFFPRLDFNQSVLLHQAANEQLFLLLPPRNLLMPHSDLARLRAGNARWLIIEKVWPGGWQLWRIVPPPNPRKNPRSQ